jgi:hypothetical protein
MTDFLFTLNIVILIPIAILGIASLQGEGESVREFLRWIYNKIRK